MTDGPNGHAPDAGAGAEAASDDVLTLADVLEDLAEDYPDVVSRAEGNAVDYAVGPQAFARVVGATAQFRLRREIVAAAVRTPGVAPSPQGPDWVTFRPASLDQYALDRAQSWFELGHRLAVESAGGPAKRH